MGGSHRTNQDVKSLVSKAYPIRQGPKMLLEANFGMATQCLVLLLAAAIFRIWQSSRDVYKKGSKLPGPPALPIIGNLLLFAKNALDVPGTLTKVAKDYGGFFRLWISNLLVVIITDPDHLQVVYSSSTTLDRSDLYKGVADAMGHNSLFVAGGERWKKLRKMHMLTFHPTPTAFLFKNFKETRDYMLEKLREDADGNIHQALIAIRYTTGNAILKNSLGRGETYENLSKLAEPIQYLSRMSYIRQISPLMCFDTIFHLLPEGKKYRKCQANVHKFIEDVIVEGIDKYKRMKENGEPIPNIYIFNMLEKFGDFPLVEFRNELLNLLMTAMDTIGQTIGFSLITLALHPDIQEQVYQEDQEIQKALAGREIYFDDLQKYELLERVIKETHRVFPLAPVIGRKLSEDTYFGKHLVPKGADVFALLIYTYMNPDIFPDPLKFNPDRFLPENVEKRHPFAHIPFSAGPRGCPGVRYAMLALKIYLPAIVREFKIGCQYTSMEEAIKNTVAEVTLTDSNNFPITLLPRKSNKLCK